MWFKDELLANCVFAGLPRVDDAAIVIDGWQLPSELAQLLTVANGMMTKNRYLRVFGTAAHPGLPSIEEWNRSEWKAEFQDFASDMIFVADDIFGDQYGYAFGPEGHDFIKFFCEGAEVQILQGGINRLIETLIDPEKTQLIDLDLSRQAFDRGMRPAGNQHLSFRLPLIVNGEYSIENLHVESVSLHLDVLAQITVQVASLPEGSLIAGFDASK
jgi:hypothetical protein